MSTLAPHIEAAALRETEDALRELVKVAQNIGCGNPSIAMMLRSVAEDLHPVTIVHEEPTLPQ
jgi:hypothetical protein